MEDGSHMTQRILQLTLEIIYLLTGEDYTVVKRSSNISPDFLLYSPPHSLPQSDCKKILEITKKITVLLTTENDPGAKCGLIIKEEAKRGEKENHNIEVTIVDQPLPPSHGGSSTRNTPERSPRPLYSQDSTQEVTPHHYQTGIKEEELCHTDVGRDVYTNIKAEPASCQVTRSLVGDNGDGGIKKQSVRSDEQCKEEECSLVICAAGRYVRRNTATQPDYHAADSSFNPDEHWECIVDESHPVTPEVNPYSCPECEKSFPLRSALVRHKRVHTRKKPYSCAECGKSFPFKSDLGIHERVHTGEKSYSCSECGKSFSVISNLIRHERIHTGEKPYSCSVCGKCFFQKSNLIRHEGIHTGEKPHACPECDKCFSEKSALVSHERVHKGEKPYSCSQCGKSFFHESSLIRHEKAHAGEKPYSCSECGRCFLEKATLISHERLHRGEKPFSCAECGKCFTQKSALTSHEGVHTRKRTRC